MDTHTLPYHHEPTPAVDEDGLPRTQVAQTPAPPVPHDLSEADSDFLTDSGESSSDGSVSRLREAARTLPEPGTEFLGFHLLEELGRGAFGRVYLARQGDLAGRLVALKVACNSAAESHTLAQLQHTNIVPIYSLHRSGPFQAVCMPYFGRTTLAEVLKEISDRPSLPSSGRELRSTLNAHRDSTLPSAGSGSRARLDPLPAADPAPAEEPPQPLAPDRSQEGWLKLEGLSYVEAVLCLGGQLAAGLAHAHARGILHRDLKPANVLLTDEGRPMLLDFNLAEDVKQRGAVRKAAVGGTLPYMAPEHVEAFRTSAGKLDERCDLYSLGVILFELLTGHYPYPVHRGSPRDVLPKMLADRRRPPPPVRQWNPAVSPAVEAIIHTCLAADPAHRYQTAENLREDIDRHLAHRPLTFAANPSLAERLGKWGRRHPKLASSATVAAVALVLLTAAGSATVYARERTHGLEARATFADHEAAFRDAQRFLDDRRQAHAKPDEALARLRGVLDRYQVPDDGSDDRWAQASTVRHLPAADRDRLRGDVGEAFFLMAEVVLRKADGTTDPAERTAHVRLADRWTTAAERRAGDRLAHAIREQRAALAKLRGAAPPAAAGDPTDPRDLSRLGAALAQRRRFRDALPHLQKATLLDPKNFSAWFVRGTAHLELHQNELAAVCFGACVALTDDFAPAWLDRGTAFSRMRFYDQAIDDFDRAVNLDPTLFEAYIQRATAKTARGDHRGAADDFTRAIETGKAPVRAYFLRAAARERAGDRAGAKADRDHALTLTPADALSWLGRAEARTPTDPAAALADVGEALRLDPFLVEAYEQKAHILAEKLNRSAEAVAALDRAVELNPDYVPARAGRGVLLARRGDRDAAIRDARESLLRDGRAPNLYQVAGIFALTSKANPDDRAEALRLLRAALKSGFGLAWVDGDADLDPIRDDPEFKRVVADARTLDAARRR